MTNYERIQQDKEFCALIIRDMIFDMTYVEVMKWLDQEQRELTDEHEHKEDL